MTRWPVMSGRPMGSRAATGRGVRMGHFCARQMVFSSPEAVVILQMGSVTVYWPFSAAQVTTPEISGGTMLLWVMMLVSGQVATTVPPETLSPGLTVTVTSHLRAISRLSTWTPVAMNAPFFWAISVSGRSMPSKIFSMMPGPSVAESGAPVPLTGSPTSRPVVFSYTWMVVRASLTLMTSPMRPAFPTYTISAMPNVLVSFTVTTGPLIE